MTPLIKRCTACGEEKPSSDFYRHARHKDGFRSECKKCTDSQNKAYVAENLQKRRDDNAAYMRRERQFKPQQARARDFQQRATNGEARKAATRRWLNSHPEQKRANNAKWARANPAKMRARDHNRRARIKSGGGRHTAADMQRQYEVQKGLCYYCTTPLNGKYESDHKIPVSRGGSSWPENMVCACAACNRKKSARTDVEFIAVFPQAIATLQPDKAA